MKCIPRDFPLCRWLTAIGFIIAVTTQFSMGQLPKLKGVLEGQPTAKPEAEQTEKPEETRARLERWLQEARDTLTRLEAATPPADISAAEVEGRRRDLEQMTLSLTRSIKNITAIAEARKDLESSRAEDAAWTGFKETPPFSLLMVDDLLNERDAIKANLTSQEDSLTNFESLLSGILSEAKITEGTVSSGILAVKNADEKTSDAVKWRLDAAREKSRLMAVRAGMIQKSCDSLKDRIAATRIDLALIDRKVAVAKTDCHLNDEDLAKINKISDERKAAFHKEMEGIAKRLKSAITVRNQAQNALAALTTPQTAEKEPDGLELAKFRVEVAEGRVDALQTLIEGLESLVQLENITCRIYQDRRDIIEARTPEERAQKLESLSQSNDRLKAWENVIGNDMSTTSADLSKFETRAASITNEDPRFTLVNDQRAAKSEKLTMHQRLSQAVISQRKLVKRWLTEYTPKPEQSGWWDRVTALGAVTGEMIQKTWSFELMNFEDKVVVDGQTITGNIPVTLGMLLRALLFFIIGYWILSRIANRIQAGMVRHGHIAEAQARTLRNWAMIVVGFFLVVGTFSFLKIPLTVFAFFGGALAIGLGFGTQTLIKNFISGIILLAERKVRVGDMLEVDGFLGKVTEINTRSSVIRSNDDMETMVPNSLFLENRVTNWTLTSGKVRRTLHVGVAYGTPPQKVMELLTDSAARHGLVCKDPPPFAIFEDFGESSLVFRLYFWLDFRGAANAAIVASDLRLMIEKRFTELEIGVPFPQRDLRLNSDQPLKVQLSRDSGKP
jgi:potassium efflux system protein